MLGFVRPYFGKLTAALIMTALLTAVGMAPPLIVKYIVDDIIILGKWDMLETVLFISLMIPVVVALLRLVNVYVISYVSFKMINDIRLAMYKHMLSLSLSFYDQMGTGKIISRLMTDVTTARSMVSRRMIEMVTELVTFWVGMVACFMLSWKLGLILILMMPLYVLNYYAFRGGMRASYYRWRGQMDEVSMGLQERLSGVRLVKAYGRERRENRTFTGDTRLSLDYAMQTAVYRASQMTGAWVASGLRNTIVFCLGCYFVIEGELSYGAVMAFQAYAMRVFQPILNMSRMAMEFNQMMVSVDRIYEIIDWPVEIEDKTKASQLKDLKGHVKFSNLWFEYIAEEPVLKDISLDVPAGTMVALVGHTGCGKTTLTSLLMRLYDVRKGSITLDGIDLRDLKVRWLRKQIGQVLQDSVIFNMSIKNNLRYGRLDATDEEIVAAARVAEIHEFILRSSDGYDTMLGDEGIKLSVGEKQRLAIARAVLTDPAILILDEATSSLDSLSEALIQKAMAKVMEGRTSFVIAHRLSTIVSADMIVVMDHGEIVEVGSHEELLVLEGGKYRQLYEHQYAGLEVAEAAAD